MVKVFVAYDDLKYLSGEKVIATRTERLSFAGQSVDLDLTDESVTEILTLLDDLFKVGTPVKADHRKMPRVTIVSGRPITKIEYNRRMREFGKTIGIEATRGKDRTWYYPISLKKAYAEYIAEQVALGQ
jgi:hypothetical protein